VIAGIDAAAANTVADLIRASPDPDGRESGRESAAEILQTSEELADPA
jgi:hypothetical protein